MLAEPVAAEPAVSEHYARFGWGQDGAWLARTFRTISRGDIDRMHKFGVEALGDLTRSPFKPLDPATAPDLLRPVLAPVPH